MAPRSSNRQTVRLAPEATGGSAPKLRLMPNALTRNRPGWRKLLLLACLREYDGSGARTLRIADADRVACRVTVPNTASSDGVEYGPERRHRGPPE